MCPFLHSSVSLVLPVPIHRLTARLPLSEGLSPSTCSVPGGAAESTHPCLLSLGFVNKILKKPRKLCPHCCGCNCSRLLDKMGGRLHPGRAQGPTFPASHRQRVYAARIQCGDAAHACSCLPPRAVVHCGRQAPPFPHKPHVGDPPPAGARPPACLSLPAVRHRPFPCPARSSSCSAGRRELDTTALGLMFGGTGEHRIDPSERREKRVPAGSGNAQARSSFLAAVGIRLGDSGREGRTQAQALPTTSLQVETGERMRKLDGQRAEPPPQVPPSMGRELSLNVSTQMQLVFGRGERAPLQSASPQAREPPY